MPFSSPPVDPTRLSTSVAVGSRRVNLRLRRQDRRGALRDLDPIDLNKPALALRRRRHPLPTHWLQGRLQGNRLSRTGRSDGFTDPRS